METSRVALIALVCVVFPSQKMISGAEMEMRVRWGDNVTLYSDCVWKSGLNPVWFRNCSEKDHPNFRILYTDARVFSRYMFVFNASTNTHNLLIKNVTESDQGLYYCAVHEKVISKDENGIIISSDVYHYGSRSTQLSLFDKSSPFVSISLSTVTPCVSECSVSWTLVFSVCAVCVLLSSLLSSICVYCLCTHTTKGSEKRGGEPLTVNDFQVHQCERSINGEFCCHTEVFYTLQKPTITSY